MDNFSGKNVLITGASSGIGLAMAKDFANRGANLILTARSEDKLMQLAKDLSGKGIKTHVFIEDISLPNSAQKLFNQVNAAELEVDVLVNNAGYGRWGNFDECPMEDYENMVHLNVTSLTELSYLFVDQMVKRGSGGIINVASTAAFFPIPYSAVYAATKAYVLSLSEALNFEYSKKSIADPQKEWLKSHLKDFFLDSINSVNFKNLKYFNSKQINLEFNKFCKIKKYPSTFAFFQILSFYRFYEIFKKCFAKCL